MVNHNREIRALIHKLASGSINETEKQRLEQMALEDPFLRDAIEGYEKSGDQEENLRALQRNFSRKPIQRTRSSWRSLRIAAGILLLISMAGIIYFSNRSLNQPNLQHTTTMIMEEESNSNLPPDKEQLESAQNLPVTSPSPEKQAIPKAETTNDQEEKVPVADAGKADEPLPNDGIEFARTSKARFSSIHPLEGRIFDDIGSPLIGAEIRLLDRDTLLFSDSEGRFVLGPEDAQQGIRISYAGYKTKEVEEINSSTIGKIILEEDPTTMSEIVISDFPNSGLRNSNQLQQSEESGAIIPDTTTEPLVGWQKYYAYLKQNLRKPKAAKQANISGIVTLSFTADQAGIPQNIMVRKSLGYGCDEEAIRLLEEGPRWRSPDPKNISIEFSIKFD